MSRFYASLLQHCSCGKPATAVLRGPYNAAYDVVCDRCKARRLKELEKAWEPIPDDQMARK